MIIPREAVIQAHSGPCKSCGPPTTAVLIHPAGHASPVWRVTNVRPDGDYDEHECRGKLEEAA